MLLNTMYVEVVSLDSMKELYEEDIFCRGVEGMQRTIGYESYVAEV
jgi:hypothetical protein